jgi:16S rRNA (uracil1498-N3)-methyltransferase
MTRRRWIADEVSGSRAAITGDHAAHLSRVLRAQVGQEFDISAEGTIRRGRVINISEDRVEFELGQEVPAPPAPNVTLLLAIFKFDRMEWAIEKCTELGVSRIVLFIARRTDSHLASASAKRMERWGRIAREASEQARRTSLPEISGPVKFKDALASCRGDCIVLSESETGNRLRDAAASGSMDETTLAIGPEGGWTEEELKSFQQAGWISASLGPTILRAETAAIAAAAIVLSELRPPAQSSSGSAVLS